MKRTHMIVIGGIAFIAIIVVLIWQFSQPVLANAPPSQFVGEWGEPSPPHTIQNIKVTMPAGNLSPDAEIFWRSGGSQKQNTAYVGNQDCGSSFCSKLYANYDVPTRGTTNISIFLTEDDKLLIRMGTDSGSIFLSRQ